jgi:hypothetical protein
MSELRDPFIRALSLTRSYDEEDEVDDADLEAREKQMEQQRKVERAKRAPKPLDEVRGALD